MGWVCLHLFVLLAHVGKLQQSFDVHKTRNKMVCVWGYMPIVPALRGWGNRIWNDKKYRKTIFFSYFHGYWTSIERKRNIFQGILSPKTRHFSLSLPSIPISLSYIFFSWPSMPRSFWDKISRSPGWPGTRYVAEGDVDVWSSASTPRCWADRCSPCALLLCSFYFLPCLLLRPARHTSDLWHCIPQQHLLVNKLVICFLKINSVSTHLECQL